MTGITVSQKIHRCIGLIWACVVFCFLFQSFPVIWRTLTAQTPLRGYIFLYILICVIVIVPYLALYKRVNGKVLGGLIFIGALLIRLVALRYNVYVLANDFEDYYNLGIAFYQKNYPAIKDVSLAFRDSKFGGIAVFYGLLAHVFSPTLLGFQIVNCIITALICLMVYILGSIVSREIALIAALLYMVYPSSILSAQMTANHHGATLFLLIAFYAFYRSVSSADNADKSRSLLMLPVWAVASGIALTCSDFIHPSALLGLCALMVFSFIQVVGNLVYAKKSARRLCRRDFYPLICLVVVSVVYGGMLKMGLDRMKSVGMVDKDLDITLLSKIKVGLDIEHDGACWEKAYTSVMEIEGIEAQRDFCINEIRKNFSQPGRLFRFAWEKTRKAWFEQDNYFAYYVEGETARINALIQETSDPVIIQELEKNQCKLYDTLLVFGQVDMVFVSVIWILVLVGLFALGKRRSMEIFNLMIWLPIGWMAFIFISEGQSRYRYPAMPSLMLLAGLGFASLWGVFKSRSREKRGDE